MRKILLINDDGIKADGLRRLAEEAVHFGEVWIVAPEKQMSACSHSITLHDSIDIYPYDFGMEGVKAYSCSGTPGDCVRVGSLSVMPYKPDVVISGINNGFNTATDIQYSATAGVAFEAAFQGYSAIAISEGLGDHAVTNANLHALLEEYIDVKHSRNEILNINIPSCSIEEFKGVLRDRKVSSGMFYKDGYKVIEELPQGGRRYMVDGEKVCISEEGTDLRAVMDNYISVGFARNIG